MLILSAKPKRERIVVDDRVEVSVLKVVGNRVYLAIHGVEGTTVDRLSVAKLKRNYESPFDELFDRLKEEPEEQERSGKSGATTLREYRERRRLAVERELR
ncbi:MAG: carbon storage regulator [Thermoguttaceae bacterium]|nr:carbon storage regulator [Thermoguttaceae bacterium]